MLALFSRVGERLDDGDVGKPGLGFFLVIVLGEGRVVLFAIDGRLLALHHRFAGLLDDLLDHKALGVFELVRIDQYHLLLFDLDILHVRVFLFFRGEVHG